MYFRKQQKNCFYPKVFMFISSFPLLLATRLVRTASAERSIAIMIRLCFWGICISSCALAVVAAVMNGFERVTHQSIQGIHADLLIRSSQPLDYQKIQTVIAHEFAETIAQSSPSSMHHVVIKHKDQDDVTLAVMTAIDPTTAGHVTTLGQRITKPEKAELVELLSNNKIMVGKILAQDANINVGETISLLYPEEKQTKRNRITFDAHDAEVGGIFATGIDEFDAHGIFTSLQTMQNLFDIPEAISTISIKLKPGASSSAVQDALRKRLSLDVVSWQELYPPLMAALLLEKYAMALILSLIVLIASMNTISLLFMYITHKKRTIGVLSALGMSRSALMTTFIALGMGITLSGAALGLLAAVGICYLLEEYQLIKLPDVYYATHLPAAMDSTIIISVLLLVLVLGFVSAWYPTRSLNRKRIAQILKFDM
jgi:lipoprotein-releasing system permease protein